MTKYLKMTVSALVLTLALPVLAHEMPQVNTPKDFEKVKELVGTWEGTHKTDKGEEKLKVTYELTSGGTAVLEKLFAGTPHEMISVYHPSGTKVTMTHYCAMGNQPEMTMKKADDKTMAFEMTGTAGIKSKNELHMHGLTVTMTDKDHMKEEWVSFEKGKKKDVTVFDLTRK